MNTLTLMKRNKRNEKILGYNIICDYRSTELTGEHTNIVNQPQIGIFIRINAEAVICG